MGPFVPNEIVDLLRMRELNTMCSVQIENEWVSISEFLNRHEKGELTVAKPAKKTEPEESKPKVPKKQKPSKNQKKAPVPEVKSSPKAAPPPVVIPKITPHTEILVVRDGQQYGPYLHRELIDYLKAGRVSLTDKCWIDGISDWVSISQIPNITDGINSLGAAAPPPPKPPPVVRPPLDFNDEEENDEDRRARSAPSDEYMKMLGLDRSSHAPKNKDHAPPNKLPQRIQTMNKLYVFRALIILEWILFFPAIGLSFILQDLLPLELQDWLNRETETESGLILIAVSFLLFIPLILLAFVSSVGLFFRKKWGAWLYLGVFAFGVCLSPFTGPVVEHALTGTINNISFVVSGIIIGMILFTNVVLEQPLVE